MFVLTAETCWAMNEYWINNKISGIKLVFSLYATIKMIHVPINISFKTVLEAILLEEQNGFRIGRSCIGNVFTIKETIE